VTEFFIYLFTLNVGVLVGFFLASLLAANEQHRMATDEQRRSLSD
jgi:MFS superfamily sulfate permease-like transporter